MSTLDFLAGRRLLATKKSKINGTLTVVSELGWGTYINAGGLTQTGGIARTIWEKSIKRAKAEWEGFVPKNVLILGFAGGGIAHVAKKLWPECEIYGVDIDPVIVELGKEYLKWDETGAKVEIGDADEYVKKLVKEKRTFDLICVDMYVGSHVPERFLKEKFISLVKKLQTDKGMVIYNRLYGENEKGLVTRFTGELKKVYTNIVTVYPEANIMFLCRK